ARSTAAGTVPEIVPVSAQNRASRANSSQNRSVEEVIETVRFVRKNEDGGEADRRLANHRLQPLGHLTAARKLSINEIAVYGLSSVPSIVPETVPASSQNRRGAATLTACGAPIRTQRFFSPTTMPATDWRA